MSEKPPIIFVPTPESPGIGLYQEMITKIKNKVCEAGPTFFGVDWAKDSGYSRGDIISREGNIIHVRFKTVVLGKADIS